MSNTLQSDEHSHIRLFDGMIRQIFRDAWRITTSDPKLRSFFWHAMMAQGKAVRRRNSWLKKGVQVPPLLIASITNRCNLRCKGCYAQALARAFHRQGEEMSTEKLHGIIAEASELGISLIMLAGGEPLVRRDLMAVTADFPEIIFPLFTNGLLIDDELIGQFQKQKNVVPVISLEGYAEDTDERRGKGVYAHLRKIIGRMEGKGIFLGCSLTVSRENFEIVTEEAFLAELIASGARLFFFVEYVPVTEGSEQLILTDEQRVSLGKMVRRLGTRVPGLFVAFPGDESELGGCLAAGRGFVHVNPAGGLEPCPFAPYSDTSLMQMPLKEALQSDFLRRIRENHGRLTETTGGCALWAQRDWVSSLLSPSLGM